MGDAIARQIFRSEATALAMIASGEVREANPAFRRLDGGGEPWRWLAGPHAKVRYGTLSELVCAESATLAPAPWLSRFERSRQVIEVRLERAGPGEALALVLDVTRELRRERELQRDRDRELQQERLREMAVLASGVAHDLNHVLNLVALRVATLRANPALPETRRALDAMARLIGDAARTVTRLQDLARPDRPAGPRAPPRHCEPLLTDAPRRGPLHILLVDDEADNLDLLRDVLELEGQEVECARSGAEALELLGRGERFGMVLLDVGMPGMSGWQVAREIQRIAPGTPVWMLTGWANEIAENDPRRASVRGVLAKPLDLDELRALLFGGPRPAPSPDAGATAVH